MVPRRYAASRLQLERALTRLQVFVDTFSAELSKIFMGSGFAETFTSFETSFINNSIPDGDGSKIVNNYAVKAKKFAVPTTLLPGSPFNFQVSPMV